MCNYKTKIWCFNSTLTRSSLSSTSINLALIRPKNFILSNSWHFINFISSITWLPATSFWIVYHLHQCKLKTVFSKRISLYYHSLCPTYTNIESTQLWILHPKHFDVIDTFHNSNLDQIYSIQEQRLGIAFDITLNHIVNPTINKRKWFAIIKVVNKWKFLYT